MQQALENLELSIRDNNARMVYNNMPEVRADESQMIQVFQNLLGNALKFRNEVPPEVQINAERRGKEWIISVRDNGIGIDDEYKDRIFIVFQRLHSREQYPGTGIGLALCKKIVERHGGKIWVESESRKGSAFYFSLPINEE